MVGVGVGVGVGMKVGVRNKVRIEVRTEVRTEVRNICRVRVSISIITVGLPSIPLHVYLLLVPSRLN